MEKWFIKGERFTPEMKLKCRRARLGLPNSPEQEREQAKADHNLEIVRQQLEAIRFGVLALK